MEEKKVKEKKGKLVIKIAVFVAAIVIAFCTLETFVIVKDIISSTKKSNTSIYENVTSIYSELVSKTLEEYMASLEYYTKADIVKTKDTDQIVSWLRAHEKNREEKFDYVAWVDKDANFYSDIGSKTNIKDRDYYQNIILRGAEEFIDNPVTSKTSGQTIVHICKAAKVDGKTVGFFCGVVNIKRLVVLLDGINLDKNCAAAMFSGDGQTIAITGDAAVMGDPKDPAVQKLNTELIKIIENCSATKKIESTWKIVPKQGNVFFVISPIEHSPWTLSIILHNQTIYGVGTKLAGIMIIFSVLLAIAIILAVVISIIISLRPLKVVEDSIRDISTGNADLTKRININLNDEIGRVVDGFNQFSGKLQDIMVAMKESKNELVSAGDSLKASTEDTSASITQILSNIEQMGNNINTQSNSVNSTAGAVNEIASNIESLNRMIEAQGSAVEQASSAVEEMIGNINSVNSSVQKMAKEFNDLEQKTKVGVQKQEEVNQKIQNIEAESLALKEANSVISSIASQTNLLAMNAAIEAAHAGEAGKGFSVVADEIRKLSENSTQQSKSIGDQLNKITESINDIVETSKQAKAAFSEVSDGIIETTNVVLEIKNSMEEQEEGSKQISIALHNMNDTTQEVRTSSYEMSEGNKAILDEVKNLQDATYSMKTGMDEMSVGAQKINETGNILTVLADGMEKSISKIGNEIDQFKV